MDKALACDCGQVVHRHVPMSQSSTVRKQLQSSNILQLGR